MNYIENNSGATYFNTGIGLNKTDTVTVECVVYPESNHIYAPLFGGREGQFVNNYTLGVKYDSAANWYLEKDYTMQRWSNYSMLNVHCLLTTYVNGTHSYLDVKTISTGEVSTYQNDNIGAGITPVCYLFSMNNNGSKYTGSTYGKVFDFAIYTNDGTERCHLVPTLRNSDRVSGFYDITNDRFITNGAGATGYHTYG